MIRFWAPITFVLIAITLIGLVLTGGHDEKKLTPAEKVAHGIYDPEAVTFASGGFETEVNNNTLLDPESPGLGYLAYLMEGSVKSEPRWVDFCQRVLPKVRTTNGILDQAFGYKLTQAQEDLISRINQGYNIAQSKFQDDPACRLPKDPNQQTVST